MKKNNYEIVRNKKRIGKKILIASILGGVGLMLLSPNTDDVYADQTEFVVLNRVTNAGFDGEYSSNKRDWSFKSGGFSQIIKDGENSFGRIAKGSNDEFILQKIPTDIGKEYTLEGNIRVDADSILEGIFFSAKSVLANGNQGPVLKQIEIKEKTDEWTKVSFDFIATSFETMVGIVKWTDTTLDLKGIEVDLDDVSLKEKETYQIVWQEDFVDNVLDQDIWGYELGNIRGNEQQHYVNPLDNVFIRDGNLVLKVTHRQEEDQYINPRPNTGGRKVIYNSGSVRTHGKKEFLYGRIEMRAKLPKGKGAFPAFWTLGSDFILDGDISEEQGYGWPSTGEIDIMELIGAPTEERHDEVAEGSQSNRIVYGTPHFYYINGDGDKDGSYNPYALGGNLTLNEDFYDKYHLFGINWSPDKIEWYVDGVAYNTMNLKGNDRLEAAAAAFHRPQFIQLNLATGGNWARNAGVYLAEDETEFIIDKITWAQNEEQREASMAYYKDYPNMSGLQTIVMKQGETPDLLENVVVDQHDYLVDFSIDDEFMYENIGGNTNVTLRNADKADREQLKNLLPGVYNIHYSARPMDMVLTGHVTPIAKINRKTQLLVVLPPEGLSGKQGEKLDTIQLPAGWQWDNNDEIIGSKQSYKLIFRNVNKSGTSEEKERSILIEIPDNEINK